MLTIEAHLESFLLIEKAKKVLKGKKDFYLSLNLVEPTGPGSSIEKIVSLGDLEPGKKITFAELEPHEKRIFHNAILPRTPLVVGLYATKKGAKFFDFLIKAASAGVIKGIGLVTGGPAVMVMAEVVKQAAKSFLEDLAKDKNDDGGDRDLIELGKGYFTLEMMTASPTGIIPIVAGEQVYLGSTHKVDKKTGEVQITRSYLPGGFGIAGLDMKFTVVQPAAEDEELIAGLANCA